MKRIIRRWLLRRRLAAMAAHLEEIQFERDQLEKTERHCLRQSNDLRLQLLNLDIRSRRHA